MVPAVHLFPEPNLYVGWSILAKQRYKCISVNVVQYININIKYEL